MRRSIVLIIVASIVILAAGVTVRTIVDRRAEEEEIRRAAIGRQMPAWDSRVWKVVDEGRLDAWTSWQLSVYEPGEGVHCRRFLLLPRGTTDAIALRESFGLGGCDREAVNPYAADPLEHACRIAGTATPWRGRFIDADAVEPSACADR